MTHEEWIEQVERILIQYREGAVTAEDAFNAILARSVEVEQK